MTRLRLALRYAWHVLAGYLDRRREPRRTAADIMHPVKPRPERKP